MTRIKICGINEVENALAVAAVGVDLIGLNFYPPSPRSLTPEAARDIAAALRAALGENCPVLVGVFVNTDAAAMAQVLDFVGLDLAQLSGDEPVSTLEALAGHAFKAVRAAGADDARSLGGAYLCHAPSGERHPALLVDAYHRTLYGGSGEEASVAAARAAIELSPRVMLAGGLNPATVGARVRALRPWGVDVASGVENGQPGRKDLDLVAAFVAAVRAEDGDERK